MTSRTLPRLKIAFTLDYEVFGDGSGSVQQEQCVPTEYLARVLELHNGKLTLFVETGQQIYFNNHGLLDQVRQVEDQLRDLYRRGHDVQLHIHPMWFFASPPDAGEIRLDAARYDLSMLEPLDMERVIATSVDYLKSVIAPVDPDYAPVAYRAGAWSMRRSEMLFKALARHGIRIDSTIAPGAHLTGSSYGRFDFTGFAMDACWQYGPMTELPILTKRSRLSAMQYVNPIGIYVRRILGRRYSSPLITQKKSRLRKLIDVLGRDYYMADFNFLSARRLARMVQDHALRHAGRNELPVILIGHSKSSYYSDRLHDFFFELDAAGLHYDVVGIADCAPSVLETNVQNG